MALTYSLVSFEAGTQMCDILLYTLKWKLVPQGRICLNPFWWWPWLLYGEVLIVAVAKAGALMGVPGAST